MEHGTWNMEQNTKESLAKKNSNFSLGESLSITKAIIPTAGLGTRFLPLTKVLAKEFLPLADKPMVQYAVEEAKSAGIEKIVFVVRPGEKNVLKYFKKSQKLEKTLKNQKRENLFSELKKLGEISKKISFSLSIQEQPKGDADAVLQASKVVGREAAAVMFVDDIFDSKTPCILQLMQIFKTCQKPVIALKKIPPEKVIYYGIAKVEKIAHRLYKIKEIVEKPSIEEAPSDLSLCGRYILTPEVFEYIKKIKPNEKGEIILADVFSAMINDGKLIYGYEIEGEWLECGDKARWLKSNFYFSLKHPEYGPELRKHLKEIRP